MNFVEELKWRGMIHDITPGTEEQLQKEVTAAYVGIDPTADSLHIGHLVSVMMLKHFQLAGHKPHQAHQRSAGPPGGLEHDVYICGPLRHRIVSSLVMFGTSAL